MARQSSSDFVEALARGLAIITAFSPTATALSVSDVAGRTSLPRPTARRLLMTLEQLGYVRSNDGLYTLTTKVLELGTTYIATLGHLGAGPAPPRGAGGADRRVELDVAARRQRHRVRGPGAGAEDHRPRRCTSAPGSPPSRRRWATSCWPTCRRRELPARAQDAVAVGHHPARDADPPASSSASSRWCASGAGRCRTSGCRSASGRSPRRSATRPGRTVAAVNVTVHAAETSVAELKTPAPAAAARDRREHHREWAHLARLPVPDPCRRHLTPLTPPAAISLVGDERRERARAAEERRVVGVELGRAGDERGPLPLGLRTHGAVVATHHVRARHRGPRRVGERLVGHDARHRAQAAHRELGERRARAVEQEAARPRRTAAPRRRAPSSMHAWNSGKPQSGVWAAGDSPGRGRRPATNVRCAAACPPAATTSPA